MADVRRIGVSASGHLRNYGQDNQYYNSRQHGHCLETQTSYDPDPGGRPNTGSSGQSLDLSLCGTHDDCTRSEKADALNNALQDP